jgi:hypothetical protein
MPPNPEPGTWQFIELHTATDVDICGHFSEAPRSGFVRNDPRFDEYVQQIGLE